jgi:hypothetical protein
LREAIFRAIHYNSSRKLRQFSPWLERPPIAGQLARTAGGQSRAAAPRFGTFRPHHSIQSGVASASVALLDEKSGRASNDLVPIVEDLGMKLREATLAGALTALIIIAAGPAQAFDFSKPISCSATIYGGGSAKWTWADASNGRGNRVVKEVGPIMMNGHEVTDHAPAVWTWSDNVPNDWQLNGPVPKGSLTLVPLDQPTRRIIAFGAAKMTDDGEGVRAVVIDNGQVAGVGSCWRKT